jgi:hypothetical protein
MGSSFTSHRPFASTTVDWVLPEKVTAILVEGSPQPQTGMTLSHCRIAPSEKTAGIPNFA